MSPSRFPFGCLLLMMGALLGSAVRPARSADIGSVVQSYCLMAVEQEMAQSGRDAPAGMAAYACRCVLDQISQGTSIESARDSCRASTVRRYSL